MKNINKKLYSVIVICLLFLCFSLSALATESSDVSAPSETTQEKVETNSNSSIEDSNDVSDFSSADEESADSSDSSSNEEENNVSTTASDSSATSSANSVTSNESNVTSISSEKVSSEKNSSTNTSSEDKVGGYVDNELNSSDLSKEDVSSKPEDANSTENKKSNKNIGLLIFLWVFAFILFCLIIASIGALVYVNKKEFLNGKGFFENSASLKRRFSNAEKVKIRNNHKNRTNVYKPRD